MSTSPRFDHVGISVAELDRATAFFADLGLEVTGRTTVEGEFIETVTGVPGSRSEIVALSVPGGDTWIELAQFLSPDPEPGLPNALATTLGIRTVALEVADLRGVLERLAAQGYLPVGGVGEYEGAWSMAHVRGPEGIVVALAQRLGT